MKRTEPDGYLKAKQILAEAFPGRFERLDPDRYAVDTIAAIQAALSPILEKTNEVAFHLADWNSDAAFILALHLFPERFTNEEIEEGVRDFIIHVPNHIVAAAKLMGFPVQDIFDDTEK